MPKITVTFDLVTDDTLDLEALREFLETRVAGPEDGFRLENPTVYLEDHPALLDAAEAALGDLLGWASDMGGWEAPCWRQAREVKARIGGYAIDPEEGTLPEYMRGRLWFVRPEARAVEGPLADMEEAMSAFDGIDCGLTPEALLVEADDAGRALALARSYRDGADNAVLGFLPLDGPGGEQGFSYVSA